MGNWDSQRKVLVKSAPVSCITCARSHSFKGSCLPEPVEGAAFGRPSLSHVGGRPMWR